MSEELGLKPLRCGHCGSELPVMGQLVTFQCPACFRYWVLGADALEPVTVYRATASGETRSPRDEIVWLPFWIADVDGAALRRRIEEAVAALRDASTAILEAHAAAERGAGRSGVSGLDPLAIPDPASDAGLARSRLAAEAANAKRPPAQNEIRHITARLEDLGTLRIFIPAFKSLNTYAYLKVGRLLTRAQPPFSIERSDGAGEPVLCALRVEEAAALMDFIFFATLGESLQSNGDFLERIHLEPARPPRLVEFPFHQRGTSLVSVIGGFWISERLVERTGEHRFSARSPRVPGS
jgi:hypothetical protein